jgi:drug/metabolite transporter (DMT)-like permease
MMSTTLQGVLLYICYAFVDALSSNVCSRILPRHFSSNIFQFLFLRGVIVLLTLIPWILWKYRRRNAFQIKRINILFGLLFWIATSLFYYSIALEVPITYVSIAAYTISFWDLILGYLILKENVPPHYLISSIIAYIGVSFYFLLEVQNLWITWIAAIFYSIYTIVLKVSKGGGLLEEEVVVSSIIMLTIFSYLAGGGQLILDKRVWLDVSSISGLFILGEILLIGAIYAAPVSLIAAVKFINIPIVYLLDIFLSSP